MLISGTGTGAGKCPGSDALFGQGIGDANPARLGAFQLRPRKNTRPDGEAIVMCMPRPLAVGLVHQSANALTIERGQARIALSLFANAEGYALVETFEVDGSATRDAATLLALEELAQRVEAVAVIVSGDVDREKVEAIAEWVRMVVLVRT